MIRRLFSLAALALVPALGLAQVAAPSFQEGVHYLKIDPPQPGTVDGKIEVVELWGLVHRAEAILHTVHDAVLLASQTQQRMLAVLERPDHELDYGSLIGRKGTVGSVCDHQLTGLPYSLRMFVYTSIAEYGRFCSTMYLGISTIAARLL